MPLGVTEPSKLLNWQTKLWNVVGVALQPVLKLADDTGALGKAIPPAAVLPVPHQPHAPTPTAKIDEVLKQLDAHKQQWVNTGTKQRAEMLAQVLDNLVLLGPKLAKIGTRYKGSYEGGEGEELATVLPIVNGLLEYHESMLAEGQAPPLALRQRPDGQWVATVWPRNMIPAFFPNFKAEVWIQPGQQPTQGQLYRSKQAASTTAGAAAEAPAGPQPHTGGVSVVLGAGNQLPVVALDILHVLLSEDKVVLTKMNPVNDYYGPLLRQVFAPLVAAGFLEFVYGGADVGKYCNHHPLVDSVHLTGSEATYNNIMFGTPTVQPGAQPVLTKPVTAELGNVTPYIIVPGQWSERDIEFHATNVASGLAQNTGHNCLAAEIIITDSSWPQRPAFLAALSRCLDTLQRRSPWYPGSEARLAAFKQRFPQAQLLGRAVPDGGQPQGHLQTEPWRLITGLSPDEAQTRLESWCGVLQEVTFTGCGGPADFMAQAVDYANNKCWGTLAASVFVHPRTQQDHAEAFEAAVADLKYGSITVNCPATAAFSVTAIGWGAFPGSTPHDVGSGIGVVHNSYLYDHPQKGVMYAPWTYSPQPLWSVGQLGLSAALPWAFRYMMNQHRPPLALIYLVMVALIALRHSWHPARA